MSASAAAAGGKRQRITVATDGGKSDCKAIANYRCATSSLYNIKAVSLIISLSGVSPPDDSSTFSKTEKVSFYWGGMPPQAPMLLLRGQK